MKNRLPLLAASLLISLYSYAQLNVPYFGRIQWINGFGKELRGENISYFSIYPDYANTALLTRCTDGNKAIEWETAPVPTGIKGKYVYFSWVAAHSSGTSKGNRNFDLYVNGEKLLTFTTLPAHQSPDWTFAAQDSSRLVFQQLKRDGANDAHGLNFLRLPAGKVKPGQPVNLKIVGQAQNSSDWYMAFKFSFEEKVDIAPMPFLLKNGKQAVAITALHFGDDSRLKVQVNRKENYSFNLKNGINNFDIPVEAVQEPGNLSFRFTIGDKTPTDRTIQVKPVTYRELHFIHHSHTDIGYSHLQPEVERIHNKNVDDALHMIDATAHLPADARFKWNIESIWVVENYLKQATTSQKQKFIKAVKDGNICLSGLYVNMLTGLSMPEEMFHYTDYAEQLRKEYGFVINSAMISDVPGFAWTTVTGLAKGGIRYFSSGPNFLGETHPYGGDRVGHFVKTWGDRPVWWTSPSGEEKVLFWAGAKGYSSWHGTAIGGVFDRGPKKIAAYLNELADKNYPYEMVQWRYNIIADNAPLDSTISEFVDQWNKKYASPKIILNTTEKLFETFEKKYGDRIPVVKGDITPYWEDGAASTASEEGINRGNSLRLQQLTTLYSLIDPKKYSAPDFYDAWKNIIMFHEHTWGAHNSITQPDEPFVTEQWDIKKKFMLDAGSKITGLENKLFSPLVDLKSNRVAVVNTASWARSGVVVLSGTIKGKSVRSAAGKQYPLQHLSNGTSVFIAENIPALGSSIYTISNEDAGIQAKPFAITDNSVTNDIITVAWDKNGSITRLTRKDGFNYAGTFNEQGLNSYWYVKGFNPSDAVSSNQVQARIVENGPVVFTVILSCEAPGTNLLERKISIYAGSNLVMIENMIDKKAVREKEAVHFGFPFNASLNHVTIDAGYGTMQYLADQLPGSNMDYLYSRRWLTASTIDKSIQWMMLEAPLIEPGSIIDERQTVNNTHKEWKTSGQSTSNWFSYLMNNYWHTNYKADQAGKSSYRYALKPHNMFSYSETEKNGSDFTQPLIAIPVKQNVTPLESLFELSNNRIVVTSITPQENGSVIVRLYNPEPASEQTGFTWKQNKPSDFSIIGKGKTFRPDETITVAGMGLTEVKIAW